MEMNIQVPKNLSPASDFIEDDSTKLQSGAEEASSREIGDKEEAELDAEVKLVVDEFVQNRRADIPHDRNVAAVLRPIALYITNKELEDPESRLRNAVRVEAFLMSVSLALPRQPLPLATALVSAVSLHTETHPKVFQANPTKTGVVHLKAPASMQRNQSERGLLGNIESRRKETESDERLLEDLCENTTSNPTLCDPTHEEHPQLERLEVWLRVKAFIKALKLLRTTGNDTGVDKVRIALCLRSFQACAARLARVSRPAQLLLPPLLYTLACELLVVRLPSPEVRARVENVVSQYEKNAKLWMYHPGSQNAGKYLKPLVEEFVLWVRENRAKILHSCATEGLLRSVDADLRYSLKNQVYSSPEHFMAVFHSVQSRLSWIHLPPYAIGDAGVDGDLSQALRDVCRETLCINGTIVEGSDCPIVLRKEIERLLGQLSPLSRSQSDKTLNGKSKGFIKTLTKSGSLDEDECRELRMNGGKPPTEKKASEGSSTTESSEFEKQVSCMLWRVLHASSRTRSGGDSFFVTQDLFGGEGILLKPSEAVAEPIQIDLEKEIVVVRSCSCYDIYDEEAISTNSEQVIPLMRIKTLMTEVLPPLLTQPSAITIVSGRKSGRYLTIQAIPLKKKTPGKKTEKMEEEDNQQEQITRIFDDLDFV